MVKKNKNLVIIIGIVVIALLAFMATRQEQGGEVTCFEGENNDAYCLQITKKTSLLASVGGCGEALVITTTPGNVLPGEEFSVNIETGIELYNAPIDLVKFTHTEVSDQNPNGLILFSEGGTDNDPSGQQLIEQLYFAAGFLGTPFACPSPITDPRFSANCEFFGGGCFQFKFTQLTGGSNEGTYTLNINIDSLADSSDTPASTDLGTYIISLEQDSCPDPITDPSFEHFSDIDNGVFEKRDLIPSYTDPPECDANVIIEYQTKCDEGYLVDGTSTNVAPGQHDCVPVGGGDGGDGSGGGTDNSCTTVNDCGPFEEKKQCVSGVCQWLPGADVCTQDQATCEWGLFRVFDDQSISIQSIGSCDGDTYSGTVEAASECEGSGDEFDTPPTTVDPEEEEGEPSFFSTTLGLITIVVVVLGGLIGGTMLLGKRGK